LKQSILIAKQTDKEHIYYFMAMTKMKDTIPHVFICKLCLAKCKQQGAGQFTAAVTVVKQQQYWTNNT